MLKSEYEAKIKIFPDENTSFLNSVIFCRIESENLSNARDYFDLFFDTILAKGWHYKIISIKPAC